MQNETYDNIYNNLINYSGNNYFDLIKDEIEKLDSIKDFIIYLDNQDISIFNLIKEDLNNKNLEIFYLFLPYVEEIIKKELFSAILFIDNNKIEYKNFDPETLNITDQKNIDVIDNFLIKYNSYNYNEDELIYLMKDYLSLHSIDIKINNTDIHEYILPKLNDNIINNLINNNIKDKTGFDLNEKSNFNKSYKDLINSLYDNYNIRQHNKILKILDIENRIDLKNKKKHKI